jgi:PST family polysaccharide transporter
MVLAAASYFRLGARVGGSLLRATGSFKSLVWAQAGYATAIIAGCVLAAPFGVSAIATVVSATAGAFFLAISLLACKRAGAGVRTFIAAHMHGMLLGMLTAVVLGAIVFVLRGLHAPDYAILLGSGFAMLASGTLIVAWPPSWLIGAPAATLAKEIRAALEARLSRLNIHRNARAEETSA